MHRWFKQNICRKSVQFKKILIWRELKDVQQSWLSSLKLYRNSCLYFQPLGKGLQNTYSVEYLNSLSIVILAYPMVGNTNKSFYTLRPLSWILWITSIQFWKLSGILQFSSNQFYPLFLFKLNTLSAYTLFESPMQQGWNYLMKHHFNKCNAAQ